jgi:hypothetical protein
MALSGSADKRPKRLRCLMGRGNIQCGDRGPATLAIATDRWLSTCEPPIRSDAQSACITVLRTKGPGGAVGLIPPPSSALNIPSCLNC